MSGINFLSDNIFKSGTKTLTTGSENVQFPLANIDNDSPSVKFRSSGNTVVIEVDLLQTTTIDTLMIAGDPTEIFGITAATYKTSVTNDFTLSPINTVTLYPEQNMGISYITPVDHRFIEITLTGQGSYVELGHISCGERINLPQNSISISSFNYGYRDRSRASANSYGQKFIDKRNLIKSISGTIEHCTQSEQQTLDDMFIKHGIHEPLWIIVDKDSDAILEGSSKLTLYGYLDGRQTWSASGGRTYNVSLSVEEAI